jgi:endo-1,4-beta-xylanase
MSLPKWITNGSYDGAYLKNIIIDHVSKVVGRYKGKIYSWDVVNEAMAWNPTDYGDGLS